MREKTNCPNCGAPINQTICPYCGTAFYDFATLDDEKQTYIQAKIGGQLLMFRAKMNTVELEMYSYDELPELEISFTVFPDDKGVTLRRMEYGKIHSNSTGYVQ